MAYRDDRVAMLARADALERALDDADEKRVALEAERDALAAESALLRAALVRAVGGLPRRMRTRARPHGAAVPLIMSLLAVLAFALAAISAVSRERWKPPASTSKAPAMTTSAAASPQTPIASIAAAPESAWMRCQR